MKTKSFFKISLLSVNFEKYTHHPWLLWYSSSAVCTSASYTRLFGCALVYVHMRLHAAEPRGNSELLFPSLYHCGTISLTLSVFDDV